jgi:hypothetical protein
MNSDNPLLVVEKGNKEDLLDQAWEHFLRYLDTGSPEDDAKFDELVRRTSRRDPKLFRVEE